MSHVSAGVRSLPLINFIPISRVFPPLLHLLLGLGNDACSSFKNFIAMRIQKKSEEEIEAQEMSFIAEIRYDEALVLHDDLKKEVDEVRQMRICANARLKERGNSKECNTTLYEQLNLIKSNLDLKSKEREEAEINAKLKKK